MMSNDQHKPKFCRACCEFSCAENEQYCSRCLLWFRDDEAREIAEAAEAEGRENF